MKFDLSGVRPEDVQIEFTGVREGEKLYEELEITGEDLLKTKHPKIFIGKLATASGDQVSRILSEFREALHSADEVAIRKIFVEHVPEGLMTTEESREAGTSL